MQTSPNTHVFGSMMSTGAALASVVIVRIVVKIRSPSVPLFGMGVPRTADVASGEMSLAAVFHKFTPIPKS
jgi:hypothetical protein